MFKLILTITFLSFCASSVHATLVDGSPGDSSFTTVNGLDWLDWSSTVGMDASTALSSYQGWRLATGDEALNLMSTAFNLSPVPTVGSTPGYNSTTLLPSVVDDVNTFLSLFGSTYSFTYNNTTTHYIFAQSPAGSIGVNAGFSNSGDLTSAIFHYGYAPTSYNPSTSAVTHGIALVRDHDVNSVPEPSAIALMGLGLVGFGVTRRKQKKN